ncbi:uncharacterized protein BT62DRAFT_81234 [Guyanagaster necrorhizus]|uniref:Uncharacterized protein n=1 Tax=Guyanagaster necrorhizus TaxID=856835 RepID=A0A9P7VUY9_9AGAR|nr:uncharacterized protein BT62DRAFT_81234 [Guyanagaster necrorhizus MCA 3950]KAG7447414.1 hypothetical protein BT62DRAFT_81234 [Guyanagaster necrorhizus MCA 3950]
MDAATDDAMSFLASWEDAEGTSSKDRLPSMQNALKTLIDMEPSFFHSLQYLITQTAICAPSVEETTLSILKPLRDVTIDFLSPVLTAWTEAVALLDCFAYILHHDTFPHPTYYAEKYDLMRLNARLVRDVFPLLDAIITSIDEPLVAELRGPYGLEPILSILKRLPWSSSMRSTGFVEAPWNA